MIFYTALQNYIEPQRARCFNYLDPQNSNFLSTLPKQDLVQIRQDLKQNSLVLGDKNLEILTSIEAKLSAKLSRLNCVSEAFSANMGSSETMPFNRDSLDVLKRHPNISSSSEFSPQTLTHFIGEPKFAELVTGLNRSGDLPQNILLIVWAHLSSSPHIESAIVDQIKFAAEVANVDDPQQKINTALETKNDILLPYGYERHAMLVKISFKENGLVVSLFNSGNGLT